MKKHMERFIAPVMILAITAVCLAGCAGISSQSYSAVGFVHGNTDDSAYMDFKKFKGNMNFTLSADEGELIHYSASLDKGSAVVYLKTDGKREELFAVEAGEDIDDSFKPESPDVVLEFVAEDKCEGGKIRFDTEELL